MNKKGFSFIETVITVVILSTSLLLVYNSYSSIISNEQKRIYYNDPAYIYRTSDVLDFLNHNTNLTNIIKNEFDIQDKLVQQIGINYSNLYEKNEYKEYVEQFYNTLGINQLFIIKNDLLDSCNFSNPSSGVCSDGINDLNSAAKFVSTLNPVETGAVVNNSKIYYDYYLVVEYTEMSKFLDTTDKGKLTKCYFASEQKYGCRYYYASIPINEVYYK